MVQIKTVTVDKITNAQRPSSLHVYAVTCNPHKFLKFSLITTAHKKEHRTVQKQKKVKQLTSCEAHRYSRKLFHEESIRTSRRPLKTPLESAPESCNNYSTKINLVLKKYTKETTYERLERLENQLSALHQQTSAWNGRAPKRMRRKTRARSAIRRQRI